jgi:hypothetical protein
MDLTAWFGSQGVFSTGDAAHIFGSGSVHGVREGVWVKTCKEQVLVVCRWLVLSQ